MKFEYFYGKESEQFTFYRIPKLLITAPELEDLSDSAKLLYSLMLDRMGLSLQNGWFDDNNRAYIIFTIEEVKDTMHCSDAKAVKLMKELTAVGLIDRIKHGQGKPAIIYVKKFVSADKDDNTAASNDEKIVVQKENLQIFNNRNSQTSKTEIEDFQKPQCNDNNINNNKNNDTEGNNIYPINPAEAADDNIAHTETAKERWIDVYNKTVTEIKEQIEYDYLICNNDRKLVDEVVEIMADVMTVYRAKYKIEGELIDCESVIHKLRKVTAEQIEVFLIEFARLYSTIHNTKAYVITALYNMPLTSNLKLANIVNTFAAQKPPGGVRTSLRCKINSNMNNGGSYE